MNIIKLGLEPIWIEWVNIFKIENRREKPQEKVLMPISQHSCDHSS